MVEGWMAFKKPWKGGWNLGKLIGRKEGFGC